MNTVRCYEIIDKESKLSAMKEYYEQYSDDKLYKICIENSLLGIKEIEELNGLVERDFLMNKLLKEYDNERVIITIIKK